MRGRERERERNGGRRRESEKGKLTLKSFTSPFISSNSSSLSSALTLSRYCKYMARERE